MNENYYLFLIVLTVQDIVEAGLLLEKDRTQRVNHLIQVLLVITGTSNVKELTEEAWSPPVLCWYLGWQKILFDLGRGEVPRRES